MSDYRFKMPDVGEGVVEAEIVEWRVKVGDTVQEDDSLVDVMTDKATVDIPAPVSGKIAKIVGEPGDVIAVGAEILVIETDTDAAQVDETTEAAPAEPPPPVPSAEPVRPPKPPSTPAAAPAPERTRPVREGRPLASPAVRQRARDADIDLGFVPGTGPAGRITHEDLEDFIASGGRLSQFAAGPTAAGPAKAKRTGVHDVRIIGLRRKIAENMARSAREIPHIAYVEEIDVTAVEALRKHLNATKRDDQPKLTFLPFLCAAMAKALPEFPQANAHYDADAGVLTQYDAAHIGVATATPNGLMVPVVRHAEALDLWETSAEIKRLSDAARQGACAREELSGSSITITSLGAIGGIVTTPIINYPETAIIGVNKMVERPAFDAGGRVVPRLFMNLSSSFDHRIVDGFEAASLVQRLKGLLENPATLFM